MNNLLIDVTEETLRELEDRNLTYEEMIKTLGLQINKSFLRNTY